MEEELIGWFASQSLGRLPYGASKGGFGYGLYFTNNRLIGVSYRNIVSRAYSPGYLLELIGFVLLGSGIAYFALTRPPADQPMPLWILVLLLTMFSAWIASLCFQLYLSPRRVAQRIQREASQSILNLSNVHHDVSVERASISQVTVDAWRINIRMKTGEWFLFGVRNPRAVLAREQVASLFQKFCSQSPPIDMFVKERKQWNLASNVETRV